MKNNKILKISQFILFFSMELYLFNTPLHAQEYSTYTDGINKITYKTVKIGNQTWMTENLNVTRFRNGDIIPQVKTIEEWRKASSEKKAVWCYYFQTEPKTVKIYNYWATVDPRGIAPLGWRIPNQKDVNILSASCCKPIEKNKVVENKQNDSIALANNKEYSEYTESKYEIEENPGHQLRMIGWMAGTNASGFNAKPLSGLSYSGKTFFPPGAQWWLKKDPDELYISYMYILRGDISYNQNNNIYGNGYPIRCLKID